MKIAISSSGESLEANVDPRFGRCACFVIVDPETMDFHIAPNPGAILGQGAGIQAAQEVSAQGVEAVLSGQMGPNAYRALAAAGIRMYACAPGSVRQAVEQFRAGSLPGISGATVPGQHANAASPDAPTAIIGTGPATGPATGPVAGSGAGLGMAWRHGAGRGFGHGFGHGRGRGRGFGRGNGGRGMGHGPAW